MRVLTFESGTLTKALDITRRSASGVVVSRGRRHLDHNVLATVCDRLRRRSFAHARASVVVLAGQRAALAIVPVRSKGNNPNQRTRGWLPQYVTGKIVRERDGRYWFRPEKVIPL